MVTIDRRSFLKTTIAGVGALAAPSLLRGAANFPKKPNIIFIFTDQQRASMMSCAGNSYLKTPAMDYIAENGIRFTRAYTTNPVCSPARVSLTTGRFAGYFKDKRGKAPRSNAESMHIKNIPDEVKSTTMAAYLKQAGYELIYGGKQHLPKGLNPKTLGFRVISNDQRSQMAQVAAEEITKDHSKPFFMVLAFINPHDICYMPIRDQGQKNLDRLATQLKHLDAAMLIPEGVSEDEFYETLCPPLPENLEPQADEPDGIRKLLFQTWNYKAYARDNYDERRWRMHRYAYCRLTEMVDSEIQIVLDALKRSGKEEETLVLFSSDHGEMDSSHRLQEKNTLYEEATNVPFVAMWKGHIPAGRLDEKHLISNGLDLLPTVCDYAGIKGVADPRGRSLRQLFENKPVEWRKTLGVECMIGRMIVSEDRFKYIKYDVEETKEHLLNLNEDPYETKHFTDDPRFAERLKELKAEYEQEWFPEF